MDEQKTRESAASNSKEILTDCRNLPSFNCRISSFFILQFFLLQLIARAHLLRGESKEKVREVVASSPGLIVASSPVVAMISI